MEYFVISAKFVPLKYYTLASQLRRLTSFSVGCSGRRILLPGQIAVMRKWSIDTFQNNGSGWVFKSIVSLDIHTVKYIQTYGWKLIHPTSKVPSQQESDCQHEKRGWTMFQVVRHQSYTSSWQKCREDWQEASSKSGLTHLGRNHLSNYSQWYWQVWKEQPECFSGCCGVCWKRLMQRRKVWTQSLPAATESIHQARAPCWPSFVFRQTWGWHRNSTLCNQEHE